MRVAISRAGLPSALSDFDGSRDRRKSRRCLGHAQPGRSVILPVAVDVAEAEGQVVAGALGISSGG